jgi:WD40 repeat protein
LLCASTPDVPQLWLALASGRLMVLMFPPHASQGVLEPCGTPCHLLGHEDRVLTLALCRAFSIAVSGSQDGTAIIWDINT